MLAVIRDFSSRGERATGKDIRLAWDQRVPAIDTYFTQGLFSMKKLMDAADPAVAESGRNPKKFKTMQELWEASHSFLLSGPATGFEGCFFIYGQSRREEPKNDKKRYSTRVGKTAWRLSRNVRGPHGIK
jgi:hypothetical protein